MFVQYDDVSLNILLEDLSFPLKILLTQVVKCLAQLIPDLEAVLDDLNQNIQGHLKYINIQLTE